MSSKEGDETVFKKMDDIYKSLCQILDLVNKIEDHQEKLDSEIEILKQAKTEVGTLEEKIELLETKLKDKEIYEHDSPTTPSISNLVNHYFEKIKTSNIGALGVSGFEAQRKDSTAKLQAKFSKMKEKIIEIKKECNIRDNLSSQKVNEMDLKELQKSEILVDEEKANFDDQPQGNDDPAADFLAREKETLAGLEDEFEAIQMPQSAESQPTAPINIQESGSDLFGEEMPASDDYAALRDDMYSMNLEDDNDFFSQPLQSFQMNGESGSPPAAPIFNPIRTVKEEPEKIKKWREEQKELLEKKDAEEAIKKEELQASAKKELEDWYARYKEQIEKSKLNNREVCKNTEREWIAERDSESPGQEWEKIAKLCDFNPKSSRNTKDTSRMRSIILQLKQSPLPAKA